MDDECDSAAAELQWAFAAAEILTRQHERITEASANAKGRDDWRNGIPHPPEQPIWCPTDRTSSGAKQVGCTDPSHAYRYHGSQRDWLHGHRTHVIRIGYRRILHPSDGPEPDDAEPTGPAKKWATTLEPDTSSPLAPRPDVAAEHYSRESIDRTRYRVLDRAWGALDSDETRAALWKRYWLRHPATDESEQATEHWRGALIAARAQEAQRVATRRQWDRDGNASHICRTSAQYPCPCGATLPPAVAQSIEPARPEPNPPEHQTMTMRQAAGHLGITTERARTWFADGPHTVRNGPRYHIDLGALLKQRDLEGVDVEVIIRRAHSAPAPAIPHRVEVGDQYGELTVVAELDPHPKQGRAFLCACKCGTQTTQYAAELNRRDPRVRSCGCLARAVRRAWGAPWRDGAADPDADPDESAHNALA